jgi:hypothetical protein
MLRKVFLGVSIVRGAVRINVVDSLGGAFAGVIYLWWCSRVFGEFARKGLALHVLSHGFQMARGGLLLSGGAVNCIDLEGGSSEACISLRLPEYT